METMHFETTINAAAEKVWRTLFDDETYRQWTSAFAEGSYAETDWKEGSKVLFLGPQKSGMVSRIKRSDPPMFMSFEHLGEVKDGVEIYEGESVKQWAGSTENYTLTDVDGRTRLLVDMEIGSADHKDYFLNAWPKALEKLKELAELD